MHAHLSISSSNDMASEIFVPSIKVHEMCLVKYDIENFLGKINIYMQMHEQSPKHPHPQTYMTHCPECELKE